MPTECQQGREYLCSACTHFFLAQESQKSNAGGIGYQIKSAGLQHRTTSSRLMTVRKPSMAKRDLRMQKL